MPSDFLSTSFVVALTAYTVGVASPGPSNMAIMATAMSRGRRHALALSAGVVCGSLLWGVAAALGLSTLLRSYSWALFGLKVLGGFYLLFLSLKAARTALAPLQPEFSTRNVGESKWQSFYGGLGMHLTNPKAIFVWLSIVALALPPDATRDSAVGIVASCGVVGAVVFFGYALAFSTPIARVAYARAHRWINATLSAVFAVAGVRLLLSRSAV